MSKCEPSLLKTIQQTDENAIDHSKLVKRSQQLSLSQMRARESFQTRYNDPDIEKQKESLLHKRLFLISYTKIKRSLAKAKLKNNSQKVHRLEDDLRTVTLQLRSNQTKSERSRSLHSIDTNLSMEASSESEDYIEDAVVINDSAADLNSDLAF